MGGTNTGTTVLDRLAIGEVSTTLFHGDSGLGICIWNVLRDRELSQVVANHLRLDLDLVEFLARVDANDAADHLGNDNHVTEVGLDEVGLLVGLSLLLGLAELLDEAHGLALQTAVDSSASTGVNDIAELVGGEVKEPVN